MWCSAADTHLKLLDRVVSGDGALPVPYVPVRVTSGTLIAHRYTFAPSCCRTSLYRRTFIHLSVSLWNDLVDPVFDGVGLSSSRAGPMPFCWPSCSLLFCLQLFSLSLLFVYRLVVWGWGLRTESVNLPLPALHCQSFLIIIIITMTCWVGPGTEAEHVCCG